MTLETVEIPTIESFLEGINLYETSPYDYVRGFMYHHYNDLYKGCILVSSSVPGHLSPMDLVYLMFFPLVANKHVCGDILEIGAHAGKSTSILNQIANINDSKIYTIDSWSDDTEIEFEGKKGTAKDFFFKRVLTDRIEPIEGDSKNALKKVPNDSISFAFIDGGHDYESVQEDLSHMTRVMKKGGLVYMHDYFAFSWPGVFRATQDFLKDNSSFKLVLEADKRVLLKKEN